MEKDKQSIGTVVKSFDIFRKLPQDVTSGTQSGAVISIVSTIVLVVLFFSEIHEFRNEHVDSEMFILGKSVEIPLQVNIDIIFPRLPCSLLSLDVQDSMGNHELNVKANLNKLQLTHDGKYINKEIVVSTESVVESLDKKEGCHLVGNFNIKKVPGNFHISSHAQMNIIQELFFSMGTEYYDLSHHINHLSFGDDNTLKRIKQQFPQSGILNQLDGIEHYEKLFDKEREHEIFNYYVNIVPTQYKTFTNTYEAFQFTANSYSVQTHQFPAIYFKHEFSPVAVNYQSGSWDQYQHLITSICAIIGGIFTIAGLVDKIFYRLVVWILRKDQDFSSI